MIRIHENTIDYINKLLENSQSKSIRILGKKGCWSGIEWEIVLDEQKEDDVIFEDNRIKILVESRFAKLFSDATIERKTTFFGKKLVIK